MQRATMVLTSKDEKEIKSGLATTRMAARKLQELGYPDQESLGAFVAALGDTLTACQRYMRLVGDFDDASYAETLGDVLVEIQAELEEIGWHTKSIKDALPKVIDWLYSQNT